MKIYALYYYDRPLLTPWLSHYCQFDCIDEIVIQNQNWSVADTEFLNKVVPIFVNEHKKKITVLPSPFKRIDVANKRAQFWHYGQPTIRNRVIERFQNDVWMRADLDEAIYGESYEDTEEKLEAFKELAETRAKQGKHTVGYLTLYSVFKDGIFPSWFDFQRAKNPVWKPRIYRFVAPFAHRGAKVHDLSLDVFQGGKWVRKVAPGGYVAKKGTILRGPWDGIHFEIDLKILHYHTLIRPSLNSANFVSISKNEIKNLHQHPHHYIHRLVIEPWR